MPGRVRRAQHGRMTQRGMQLSAATVLVAAVPAAVWGLMGQQNTEGFAESELEYAVRPWNISDGVAAGIGVVGLLLAAVATAALVRASRRGLLDRRWWSVLGPLTVAGVIVGAGWRVMTAGVLGANIGAGLVVLLGGPVVAGLVLWALIRTVWLTTRRGHGVAA